MEIRVASVASTALRCAYCHDDLMAENGVRCHACSGYVCRECPNRCPVWGCSADLSRPFADVTPLVEPIHQPVEVAPAQVERVQPTPAQPTRLAHDSNRLWPHILLHSAIGLIVIGVLAFAQPPLWVLMSAAVAYIVMTLSDTFMRNEEES